MEIILQAMFNGHECFLSQEKITHSNDVSKRQDLVDLPINHLSKEKLSQYNNIQIITHPLYSILYENNVQGDSIEQKVTNYYNYLLQIIRSSKQEQIPNAYWKLKEVIEEYQFYQNIPTDTLRIFMIPGRLGIKPDGPGMLKSNVPEDTQEHQKASYQMFCDAQKSENTLVIESKDSINGNINPSDFALLSQGIKSGSKISISGGYVQGCMSDTVGDMAEIGKEIDMAVDIGHSASIQGGFDQSDLSRELDINQRLTELPSEVQLSLDDIIKWYEGNNNINLLMDKKIKDILSRKDYQYDKRGEKIIKPYSFLFKDDSKVLKGE